MVAAEAEAALLARSRAANVDHDAGNVTAKTVRRTGAPAAIGDRWAERWGGAALNDFVRLSPAERQHLLASEIDAFLQSPANLADRVRHSAQSPGADLRTAAYLAEDWQDVLIAFGRDVTVPATRPFTGKVKYQPPTDLDVVTTQAIVEVTNQSNAGGRVAQLAVLLGPEATPGNLPVFHAVPSPAAVVGENRLKRVIPTRPEPLRRAAIPTRRQAARGHYGCRTRYRVTPTRSPGGATDTTFAWRASVASSGG